MCGIVGYVNHKIEHNRGHIIETMLESLARLDYRGYDSTGLVIDDDDDDNEKRALPFKIVGKVADLKQSIVAQPGLDLTKTFTSHAGIAHTRWAANGKATVLNCHPISSDVTWRFSVVHNGIVTNYKALRSGLAAEGYQFEGDTDTEVIAKLAMRLHDAQPYAEFHELATALVKDFEGSYSFLLKSSYYPNEVIAVRKGLPLIIGIQARGVWQPERIKVSVVTQQTSFRLLNGHRNGNGMSSGDSDGSSASPSVEDTGPAEFFLASDAAAIIRYTDRMVFLEDDEIAHVHDGHLSMYKYVEDEQPIPDRDIQIVKDLDGKIPSKGSFPHYMRKEIFEQPQVIEGVLSERLEDYKVNLKGLDAHIERIRGCSRLVFVACGSSYYASLAVRDLFEELNDVFVSVEVASEFLDRLTHVTANTAFVFVTQSGETAECLMALRRCKDMGCLTIGVVNVVNSSIARLTDCVLYIKAGVEISVATTKAYTSQLVNLVLLALALGERRPSTLKRRKEVLRALHLLPDQMRATLKMDEAIKGLCERVLTHARGMLVLGRGYQYATALEAALKIKEVSYIHCEAVLSGELKHGVLALVDDDLPVVMIATRDTSFVRSLNSHEQLISHGGKPIMVCNTGETAFETSARDQLEVVRTADCLQGVLNVLPLQLMGYWLGVLRGNSVDFPRHVAKSVTVE